MMHAKAVAITFLTFCVDYMFSEEVYSQEVYSCVDGVDLSFENSNLTANNLCGKGPADWTDEVIMYENVGEYGGDVIDLVISVDDCTTYNPANSQNNGLRCLSEEGTKYLCELYENVNGYFGQINQATPNEATFLFTFYKSGSFPDDPVPLVLPGIKASFFDIDQANKAHEDFIIKGWETAMYYSDTDEAYFSETDGECDGYEGNCLHASSLKLGKACDNPTNPFTLNQTVVCGNNAVNQKARSFQVDFLQTSSFEFTFRTRRIRGNPSGRNAVFSFGSEWDLDCNDPLTSEPRTEEPDDGELCFEEI